MKLAFFSNNLNHHQVYLADEFFRILGNNYSYIVINSRGQNGLKGGRDYSSRSYCILAKKSDFDRQRSYDIAKSADVCVFGAESLDYAIHRARFNPSGLSFELSERWLKKGWINILSPNLLKWRFAYQCFFRKANFYKLNASAFGSSDHAKLQSYKNRCYKWGYFTEVLSVIPKSFKIQSPNYANNLMPETDNRPIRLMWCARFIEWKHPEIAIECSKKLKDDGYKFELHMYGDGVLQQVSKKLVTKYGLSNQIYFHGNVSNKHIHQAMRQSEIFLFTSDKNEGWGAVANEAMSEGCCLVASDDIGSAPYLIKNGKNGFLYNSSDIDSLVERVEWLFKHTSELMEIRVNAKKTMSEVWSPKKAAENLLQLIDDLQNGRPCSIKEGPASVAEIIN